MTRTHQEPDPVDMVYGTLSLDVSTDEAVQALRGESDLVRDTFIRYLIDEPSAEGARGSTVQTLDEDIQQKK
jgi:hypothetical protein